MPHATKEGHFEVVDGNGTYTSVKKHGWKQLPTKVVDREEGARIKAESAAKEVAEGVVDQKKYAGQPRKGAQPTADQKELYTKATEAIEHLKTWLNRGKGVASQMGFTTMTKPPEGVSPEEWKAHKGMLFIAPLKSAEGRAKAKVDIAYGGDWSKLTDVVRCTLAVDTLHDIADAIKTLESHGMEVMQQPKNKFAKPTSVGYRDVHFLVRMPNGIAAEVQINLKDMLRAKNDGHKQYEITRQIFEKYEAAGMAGDTSTWDPKELEEYSAAFAAQRQIYDQAWTDHVKKNYGSSSKMIKSLRQVFFRIPQ